MAGVLRKVDVPAGSNRPDVRGYIDTGTWRYELVGWTQPDGSIRIREDGKSRSLEPLEIHRRVK